MKKLVFVLFFALFLGSLLGIGATKSFFTDTEKAEGNVLSVATDWGITPTPTPTYLADHIVISEIQIHGANANQDFVELYNPTDQDIDLSGWKIRKKTSNGTEYSLAEIASGKIIPAFGFFLWANNQNNYDQTIGADQSNTNNLSENNSLALKKPDGQIVDQVAWGISTNPFIEGTAIPNNPATNQSIERKAYATSTSVSMANGDALKGNAYDSQNNFNDFVLRTISNPQNSLSDPEIP